jgi:hypothetical protein
MFYCQYVDFEVFMTRPTASVRRTLLKMLFISLMDSKKYYLLNMTTNVCMCVCVEKIKTGFNYIRKSFVFFFEMQE